MIEFFCEHCNTNLSIAPEQIGDEIFCPACEEEVRLPQLSLQMEAKLHIALAQAKTGPIKKLDPEKVEKLLEEPDSKETKKWKEQLTQAFKSSSLTKTSKILKMKFSDKKDGHKSGIRKIFDVFSDKNKD